MNTKRLISVLLSAGILVSAVSCGTPTAERECATALSSSSEKYATWLSSRLGDKYPADIILGTAEDAESLGIDVSALRDEGYTIKKEHGSAVIIGKTADGLDRGVRYYANNMAELDSGTYTFGEGYAVKSLTVAGHDISEYTIILPEVSDTCHEFAASELQRYIKRACGAELPTVPFGTEVSGRRITLERVMRDSEDYAVFGDESLLIAVDDAGDITLKGGYYRGCLYAVYELLESYVGYRFVYNYLTGTDDSSGVDYLYEANAIDIPAGTYDMQSPSIDGRDTNWYQYLKYTAAIAPLYSAKRKAYRIPNYALNTDKRFNLYGLCKVANHGVVEPYYAHDSYDPNGQPCFTDEGFLEHSFEIYVNKVNKYIEQGAELGKELTTISTGQMDTSNFCICADCTELVYTDGGYIGPVLYFANRVAEVIEREFGSTLYVSTFAYFGTASVPLVNRPRDNVQISYCFYNDIHKNLCYSHPIDGLSCRDTASTSPYTINNSLYAKEFEEWCDILNKNQLSVWYYPGTWEWSAFASPIDRTLRQDIAYIASHEEVYSIFTDPAPGPRTPADLIRPYLIDRLMWDAEMSEEEYRAVILDYYTVMLGAESARCIIDCMELADSLAYDGCWSSMAWSDPSERLSIDLAIKEFPYMLELYSHALDAAESEAAETLVGVMYCAMLHMELTLVHDPWYLNGDTESRERYAELYEMFREYGTLYGYSLNEEKSAASGKVYNIEDNPSFLFGYNKSSGENDEWWLG